MTGGLLQLVTKGPIDSFLTAVPEITFFKTVHHRHTNYAIETYEEIFKGHHNFGNITECEIKRYGDLITGMTLQLNLPALTDKKKSTSGVCVKGITDCYCDKCCLTGNSQPQFSWANSIGHVLIDYVELYIGGKCVDKRTGESMEIFTELSQTYEKRQGYNEMIGKKEPINFNINSFDGPLTLYVPLDFWFCRDVGSALPIIGLYYEEVIVRIKWRNFDECYVSNIHNARLKPHTHFQSCLLIDYVYLDIVERDKFLSEPQSYFIEQLQETSCSYSKSVKHPKLDIGLLHHTVKELVWVVQRNDVHLSDEYTMGNDHFNYGLNKNRLVLPKTGTGDTFETAKIILGGHDRTKEFKSSYFRLVQAYKNHTRIPNNYIYTYSFCFKPEEIQPTGSCNFSLFHHVYLQLFNVNMTTDYVVKLWAPNINIMLVADGMCGIAEL